MTPSKQQVLEYGERLAKSKFPCEKPCDSFGVCDNCSDALLLRVGFQQAVELLWLLVSAVKKETDNAANDCECHLCEALRDLEQKIGESDA